MLAGRKPGLSAEQFHAAAIEAEGYIGRALSLLDSESEEGERANRAWDAAQSLLSVICTGDEFTLLSAVSKYERQKESFVQILPCLKQMVKEASLKKFTSSHSGLSSLPAVKEAASKLSALQSMKILDIIDNAARRIRQNVNFNLVLAAFCAETAGSGRK